MLVDLRIFAGYFNNVAKRKKQQSANKTLFIFIILPCLAMVAYYGFRYIYSPKFVHYSGFGIDIPVNYTIHGIDVSRHQSDIDWEEVKAMQIKDIRIGFGFIKATEGVQNEDDQFINNWQAAKRAGIARGAYHFFVPSKSGVAQAENFISVVRLSKGDLPPVLDVEQLNSTSVAKLQQGISDWLTLVETHYHIKPIIYTNAAFYNSYLGSKFDGYPLWVAHYLVKDKPRITRSWVFWQHNETGLVNGIEHYVDFNVFNGDSSAFNNLLVK